MHIADSPKNFNADRRPAEPPRCEFLRLGAELHHRGQQPVSQFVSELADLPPDVVAEVWARLQAYTRIDAATYRAVGADTFSPFMVVLYGGRP